MALDDNGVLMHMTAGARPEVVQFVTRLWCATLGVTNSDPGENFFGLGGNSLLAVQFVEGIEGRFGLSFPLELIFTDGRLGVIVDATLAAIDADGRSPISG
jgi:hypothetical protein